MPFIEITGSDQNEDQRRRLSRRLTAGLAEAYTIPVDIVTIYFAPLPSLAYSHAGELAPPGPVRNFVKVHAFPREVALKRRAAALLTAAFVDVTACEAHNVVIYFFDRDPHDVAHGGVLACD